MRLFYCPDIEKSPELPEDEAKHAIKVLRLSAGDAVSCVDGTGNLYHATIQNITGKKVAIEISETVPGFNKPKADIHLAVAPTKNNDRFEWLLEKATEIGVSSITPILCDHSERKIIKSDRFEKILVAAMKQSLSAYKPVLNPLTPLKDLRISGQKFIAHCEHSEKSNLISLVDPSQSSTILIGPEGDFSSGEIRWCLENGFVPVSLGDRRLRTETAGIVACHTIQIKASM